MRTIQSIAKSIVYEALDIATAQRGVKRVINGVPIRFPARWCRYYPANYEPETFALLRERCKPGHTVLDIGAHIGLFSVVIARLVGPTGRVFSFEPTPTTNIILKETVRLNKCEGIVEVRNEAVAQTTGNATFYYADVVACNANSLAHTQQSQSELLVQTVSVDDFVISRGLSVNLLKIDVEGAELSVLAGAERTFMTSRPVVSLALHPEFLSKSGATLAEIWKLLQQYRMSVRYLGREVEES